MARASGSYPAGRWFKSDIRYHVRLVGQAVKTPPFHGGNGSSILPRVTKQNISELLRAHRVVRICFLLRFYLKLHIIARGDAHLGIASFFAFSASFFSCSSFHSSNSRFASSVSKNATILGARHLAISFIKSSGISHSPCVSFISPLRRAGFWVSVFFCALRALLNFSAIFAMPSFHSHFKSMRTSFFTIVYCLASGCLRLLLTLSVLTFPRVCGKIYLY